MKNLIENITKRIRFDFSGDSSGHDWWHIQRVVTNALIIQNEEGGDRDLIHLAALLHDVGDHKFHKEEDAQEVLITEILSQENCSESLIEKVLTIVKQVSFKGGKENNELDSLEARIVQDADRLDAIGAVGIARAFAFGGNRNRLMYHPDQSPKDFKDFEEYKNDNGHTINHFYEKLLLLKDKMQTASGKRIALQRHEYMEGFLKQFYSEWNVSKN
jgi:uncharacterized protein